MQHRRGLLYNNWMRGPTAFLFFTGLMLGAIFFVAIPFATKSGLVSKIISNEQFASVFFIESVKPEIMKQTVALANINPASKKLRIMVVPGHDNEYWGTQFLGMKEADLTLELSRSLVNLLSADGEFDVLTSRTESGYNPLLSSYFASAKYDILKFAKGKKQVMNELISDGKVKTRTDGVSHNNAPSPVVVRLYGINKWANENDIDLVVHIHLNDYPRRKKSSPGEYSGFAIYVPERQYSNARASKDIALSVSKQLKRFFPESNMKKESAGVVEDQDLIAIGSFNTLDPASILIEYGYIYEAPFQNATIRRKMLYELATATYVGIQRFFNSKDVSIAGKYQTSLLPHRWDEPVSTGAQFNPDVLSLQAALVLEGVYPPTGSDPHDCPMAGTYGACTRKSIEMFQHKYGISDKSGTFGEGTARKLTELYGE
ncbi:MAG: hypothetical protein EXS59_01145 [Candidatus Taylorbacteria bacterium]|nr:hypothetical protein [Candidatus Taylorbacteria bacterium]